MAIIEFDPSGTILSANANFCRTLGYAADEIVGRHHRMFVDAVDGRSSEYHAFWDRLAAGESISGEFRRFGKGGREVWIQASYNAVRNRNGTVYKVVKFAADVTAAKFEAIGIAGKLAAVSRAQAIIEFTPNGEILAANSNFLDAMGYGSEEIVGRRHRMFVCPEEGRSGAYETFWERLRAGEFIADEFKRIGKNGREVWIQASYNPIFNLNGEVVRIVKFATDVTARVVAVQKLGSSLAKLAEGDLEQRLPTPFAAALEPLRTSFNASVETLRHALRTVRANADGIEAGSAQIRMAADDLAHRTEQQAAALEETSAALSEITAGVGEASRRAGEAGTLVERTKAEAEHSSSIVAKAIEAMHGIEQSSSRIGKIIAMIDEIAFQTNLLALNAGIEAARAGDAGRGFAVVAQEVRGLAQRSADAAKEIRDLITLSNAQIGTGVALVGKTGAELHTIVERIAEVNRHVLAIVATAKGQASSLAEVNVAIGALDQTTQRNAAMVEESTAASNELAGEAAVLNKLLERFRTGDAATSRTVRNNDDNVVRAFPQRRR
ncbi:PAS domain-containing methyl-accepting chemotaxis protein [Aureimonas sp. ME7]|uniref:methyl-accepting chemotaxis protein n=1 Tax=Aureimonas sp. ME7 TaxID=2744252 RepID=UPI001FCEC754|nr:PAS domain-containing methyl-accepting chemotaxis protein [Aureimonas sp. ME7]